jgi:hypothetical protein
MDMERSRREDPRLSEVKAVLQRLQRISTGPETASADPPAATEQPPPSRRAVWGAALGVAAAAVIGAGVFAFGNLDGLIASTFGRLREAPVAAPKSTVPEGKTGVAPGSDALLAPPGKQPQRPVRPALEAAIGLLSAGRVQAARKQLLAIASEDAVEVAWTLARSYDPNFLDTIPGADARPDIPEAARWYRAWHAAALKQGLVTNSVSLERIIGSMR